MALYLRTLPVDARLSRRAGDDVQWSMDTELRAQTLEVLSVLAADRRLRKPIEVKRPGSMKSAGHRQGFQAVYAAAVASGRVRSGG